LTIFISEQNFYDPLILLPVFHPASSRDSYNNFVANQFAGGYRSGGGLGSNSHTNYSGAYNSRSNGTEFNLKSRYNSATPNKNNYSVLTTSNRSPLGTSSNPVTKANTASSSSASSNPDFEKAVINAAISVAQQREAGVYKPAKRSNYTPQPKKSSGDNTLHYCDVCKVSCGGAQTYQSHIAGKQHKKKASQIVAASTSGESGGAVLKTAGKGFHCELCDISCTSIEAYNAHTSGAKHQKVARLHQKLGKPVPDCEKPSQVRVVSAGGVKFKSGGQLDSATGVTVKNAKDADDDE
jgi:zinc finger RNA-binding protein